MSAWELYWITRLDSIAYISEPIAVFSGFLFVCAFVATRVALSEGTVGAKENARLFSKATKVSLICLIVGSFFWVLTPTTKEYLGIMSVEYVTNNEKVLTTAGKMFDAVDQYLDERLSVNGADTP